MTREDLEAVRRNNAAVVKDTCSQYGLYGNVIYYEGSPVSGSALNRMYAIAGVNSVLGNDKLPKNLRPEEMLQTIQRNDKLFYPRAFVLDLKEIPDEGAATVLLVEYCKKAEFLNRLYAEYGLPVPKVLRESEVHQLMSFRYGMDNPNISSAMKRKYKDDLDWFFRREKSKNKLRRSWLDYFRSDKFPDGKGPIAKIRGFFHRDECTVSLPQLMENTSDVSKLELQEYEYKIFQKLIQERYPFVTYAVGDKDVIDHGINKQTQRDDCPLGKYVTAEEYAVIRKDRFAEEGWDCVANLKPAYWEFRDVYYKDVDEPIIASVYQHIALQYAKCDSLGDLRKFGPMRMQKVPLQDFMNFVSLAKGNKLRFYIDTLGEYDKPSLVNINVLYNVCQQEKMDGIIQRMIDDKVSFSHVLDSPRQPSLRAKISEIEEARHMNPSRMLRREPPYEK